MGPLIVISYGVSFALLALWAGLTARYWPVLPDSAKIGLINISGTSWAAAAVCGCLNIAATVQLCRLKRSAFYLYSIALVLGLVGGLRATLLGSEIPSLLYMFMSLGLPFLVCWYTWSLYKRNVLTRPRV